MSERDEGFRKELASLINCYSRENGSDTPDFILADYLDGCLRVFDGVLQRRETWYGRKSPFQTEVGALASPAAAPAADQDEVATFGAFGHGEPSEPAAPAPLPDLRALVDQAVAAHYDLIGIRVSEAEAIIAALAARAAP